MILAYRDVRDFVVQLEAGGDLRRIVAPADPKLEMAALCGRALRAHSPAPDRTSSKVFGFGGNGFVRA